MYQYTPVLITTVLTAVLVFSFPQYLTTERVSHSVVRFGIVDFLLFLIWKVFIYPFFFSPLRNLPGPTSYNIFIGSAATQISKFTSEQLRQWSETIPNNGLLRFRSFGNQERLIVTSPEALKSVLSDNNYDYEKPQGIRKFLVMILGEGLILAEGGLHKFQRKHLLPAFQVQHIRGLYPVFWDKSKGLVDAIAAELLEGKGALALPGADSEKHVGLSPVIEFDDFATRVTLDIIGLAGMGLEFNSLRNFDNEIVRDYNSLLEPSKRRALYFVSNILGPQDLIQALPIEQTLELRRITTNLKKFCMELVREKRQTAVVAKPKKDMDILSLLIESNDFSDEDLVDQLLTFLAAGHETTSSTLTWAVYLLAINQDWQTRLRAEIRSNLPVRSTTQPPTPAEIEALPILNAICNETLRLYPVVPVTVRTAIRPTTISVAGYPQPVPAGTRLLISPWAINRSPDLWGEKADQFVPNRWLEDGMANTGGATNNYANMTFLHGPRSCIGQGFAKAEFKCLLAVLAGAMKWEMADPGKVVQPMAVVTTKVVDGIKVRMEMVDGW